jgi:hypothetical protein
MLTTWRVVSIVGDITVLFLAQQTAETLIG